MTSTEAKFQISDKIGDAILLGRADTADEAYALIPVLHDLKAQYVGGVSPQQAVANVTQMFPTATPVSAPAAAVQSWGQPPTQQPPAPSCVHGVRTFRSGTGSNGKPWKAYFCPTPKGSADQCEPIWDR